MRITRRAAFALTVPLLAAPVAAPPAAHAAPGGEPVGGPRMGERGLVVNPAQGVKGPPKVAAGSFIVADAGTGQVLAAKDPHGHYLPASALKMLTAVALIPKLDPNATVRPTQETCDVEGSKVGMSPKLTYRVSDLFHALLMVSGNDAALALAQAAGGVRPTLDLMNAEARRLQAYDTLAGSPNGLDKDLGLTVRTQHTSAYDLALIMRQGLKMPRLREYAGKNHHRWIAPPTKAERKKGKKIGGYPIYSHIRLLPGQRYAYEGFIGGKNGFTLAAGQTFVGAAERDGRTIIVALMRGENLWPDTTKLLDWGFAAAGKVDPVGRLVDPVPPRTEKKEDDGLLPGTDLLADDASGRNWLPAAGAFGGAAVVAGGLFALLRRRGRDEEARVPAQSRPPSAFGAEAGQHPQDAADETRS
ncbi:D-alanyl-D-alanine carboxypeptidase family protein [Thermomonospora cellulosilytica]|uniref:D-alanyl-D-alanine carboxypeptidase (Penicillin-binding protein 5/6) n=1 Tax=Thermomonospora cellulosilytica TaxID=1411118 RepID=A0A7W3R661_9ACTN|nr:D-alanyl-D-alanine carboxypeptidase [Thermomonospora cellulosilytica]MBA9001171.1 D-alanyl-D-alanine carboxypeptidase (penicillin-binding protein 5/6) [Thermomonospora cellulosilytica]